MPRISGGRPGWSTCDGGSRRCANDGGKILCRKCRFFAGAEGSNPAARLRGQTIVKDEISSSIITSILRRSPANCYKNAKWCIRSLSSWVEGLQTRGLSHAN